MESALSGSGVSFILAVLVALLGWALKNQISRIDRLEKDIREVELEQSGQKAKQESIISRLDQIYNELVELRNELHRRD